MSNPIRVKDPVSGHEYDIPGRARLAACPDLVVLDKPTGKPTKPRLPLGTPLPGGEVERKRAQKTSAADQPPADQNDGQSVATDEEK